MAIKVGINGFGRIGRNILRASLGSKDIDIVAVNDITDTRTLAHLLKYDSILGNLQATIESAARRAFRSMATRSRCCRAATRARCRGRNWAWTSCSSPRVCSPIVTTPRSTFRRGEEGHHLRAREGPDGTFVMGVNQDKYDPAKHSIISNASCTTNCLAPFAKVLHESFGIERGWMTTIHSYTNDQQLLDLPHKDLRRARAAALSMIPTTTGAAEGGRRSAAGAARASSMAVRSACRRRTSRSSTSPHPVEEDDDRTTSTRHSRRPRPVR